MFPERTCETCTWYRKDGMGDYGTGPYELRCGRYDQDPEAFTIISGIPTDPEEDEAFPYTEAPDCYAVEFWQTDFANDVDGSSESLENAYNRFRAFIDHGHPL